MDSPYQKEKLCRYIFEHVVRKIRDMEKKDDFPQSEAADNRTKKETGDMINYIRNLRIRLKLYILIGVALIGMFIIGGMSFYLMGRMNEMTDDISTSWLPSIDTARDLTNTLSNIRLNELGYLTAISDDAEASSLQYLQKEKG